MTKLCSLSIVVDEPEPCPGDACAFWQPGGDDIEDGCAVERLDLDRRGVDVAELLLSVRHRFWRDSATVPPPRGVYLPVGGDR